MYTEFTNGATHSYINVYTCIAIGCFKNQISDLGLRKREESF